MSGMAMLCVVCVCVMLQSAHAMNRDRIIWDRVDSFDSDSYQELAAGYLTKFGYMSQKKSVKSSSLQSLDRAITKFQEFSGLEPTGKLTEETVEYMQKPRCGVKDIIEEDEDTPRLRLKINSRGKRYALQGSRWRVRNLTYRISKYPSSKSGLSKKEVDDTMEKAFKVWEKPTDLKFEKKTSGKVHIDIRFERRSHGDDDPFDGEGGTLAHAFFPVFGGDAHFDDDEDWTVNTPRGTSLLMTASHELGHSLGLSHSNVRRSLMAPFYRGYEKDVRLDEDDIRGIQALYGDQSSGDKESTTRGGIGVRTNTIPTTTTQQPKSKDFDNKELCRGNLDTMVTLKNDITYAFSGNRYWKLTETSVAPGYPRDISSAWDGLPGNLDAAFTWTNGKTYFFKGSQYWRFSEVGRMDRGYPKDFSKGFSGVPEGVDAAMVWPVNKKIYFFKGTQYWKFDPEKSPPVDTSYPRPISNWDGIPTNLDAAMQYSNEKTYFFKDGKYYRFDDERFSLDEDANPPFPRETGFWWFGCQSNSVRLTKKGDSVANDYVIDYHSDSIDDVMWNEE
eukprot:TRINITY_DN8369_c0_g1_i1.p1 TRINITY_DN8369_c0_g1~~TRINITY_DN8369_c0_g1_i1.p1  ORF type:complete len:559 (+),score=136.99 TRINITY_DN8369_c0_g1_i1:156-1832(+)